MGIREIIEGLLGLKEQRQLGRAREEPEAAARDLVEEHRKARAAGRGHTSAIDEAAERLSALEQNLKQARAEFEQATAGPEPEPLELTELVLRKVRESFPAEEQAEAISLLEKRCGRNLPYLEDSDARGLERVRLAVVKLSGGSLGELERQVEVAKQDWRDVLILAESPEAVREGLYRVMEELDAETRSEVLERDRQQYERWLRGGGEPETPGV